MENLSARKIGLTVDFFPVTNGQNQNEEDSIVNFVNDSIISNPKAVTILKASHFLRSHATGIFREFFERSIQTML